MKVDSFVRIEYFGYDSGQSRATLIAQRWVNYTHIVTAWNSQYPDLNNNIITNGLTLVDVLGQSYALTPAAAAQMRAFLNLP